MIEIDHKQLDPDTLNRLLTEIVLREGTDYGVVEVSVEDKKQQLLNFLILEQGALIYHASEGFCEVVSRADFDVMLRKASTESVDKS
jgi:uncharacterized protein